MRLTVCAHNYHCVPGKIKKNKTSSIMFIAIMNFSQLLKKLIQDLRKMKQPPSSLKQN